MFPLRSFTFTALNQTLDLSALAGENSRVFLQVVGAGVLELVCENSLDGGTTYGVIQAFDAGTGVLVLIDHAALYLTRETSLTRPRIRCSAFTSGSFTVYARVAPLSLELT